MKKFPFLFALIVMALVVGCAAPRPKPSLRRCKYTYVVQGVTKYFYTCAPACPVEPAWQDIGPCP